MAMLGIQTRPKGWVCWPIAGRLQHTGLVGATNIYRVNGGRANRPMQERVKPSEDPQGLKLGAGAVRAGEGRQTGRAGRIWCLGLRLAILAVEGGRGRRVFVEGMTTEY